jgi:diazepam-binding inhibitor (GABA receptor modulator, acyl-CoA-binding protein)
MTPEELDIEFQKAYEKVSRTRQQVPPDLMLMFYAYYKQATEDVGIYKPSGKHDVRSSFKMNALLQVKGVSRQEAKQRYIELVKQHITED